MANNPIIKEILVEFVLGNGYYEDPNKYVFEGMDIDRLKLDFDRLNVCSHPLPMDFHTQNQNVLMGQFHQHALLNYIF